MINLHACYVIAGAPGAAVCLRRGWGLAGNTADRCEGVEGGVSHDPSFCIPPLIYAIAPSHAGSKVFFHLRKCLCSSKLWELNLSASRGNCIWFFLKHKLQHFPTLKDGLDNKAHCHGLIPNPNPHWTIRCLRLNKRVWQTFYNKFTSIPSP